MSAGERSVERFQCMQDVVRCDHTTKEIPDLKGAASRELNGGTAHTEVLSKRLELLALFTNIN